MLGNISIQRIYSLGNYENLTVKTELSNVPENIVNDPVVSNGLQLLLLLNVEMAYRTYIDLVSKTPRNMDNDDAILELTSLRNSVYQLLRGRKDESQDQFPTEE